MEPLESATRFATSISRLKFRLFSVLLHTVDNQQITSYLVPSESETKATWIQQAMKKQQINWLSAFYFLQKLFNFLYYTNSVTSSSQCFTIVRSKSDSSNKEFQRQRERQARTPWFCTPSRQPALFHTHNPNRICRRIAPRAAILWYPIIFLNRMHTVTDIPLASPASLIDEFTRQALEHGRTAKRFTTELQTLHFGLRIEHSQSA